MFRVQVHWRRFMDDFKKVVFKLAGQQEIFGKWHLAQTQNY